VVALSVAAVLAVFLVYTSIAGGQASLIPSQLPGHKGRVTLTGKVVGKITGQGFGSGFHFRLRDVNGNTTVPVVYHGSVGDMFRTGRDLSVDGRLKNGVFVGVPGTLVTKCPSKYAPAKGK
jgi:cytochrome c-type biogenesis protein CcmE